MNRSQGFIVVTSVLLAGGGLLFYALSKPLRYDAGVKAISMEKESEFRAEVKVLDSLYRNYVSATLAADNQSAIALASAQLDKQLSGIKARYGGTGSPPAVLAAKLVRNYEFRLLLHQKLLGRRHLQADEVNRLSGRVRELEAQNAELKTQNQMVEQALLNLPN
ncbi:hypothetical protein [Salmonirosea aquatica]|uniref:Uncharacterized protein n=1 Tax=Salmonirosea aquatica TaxID=2654236 RepID=A0A7C9BKX1_9BACT|nr:hypothetical protein [Cytophagaceae bacterium SJW1-29]